MKYNESLILALVFFVGVCFGLIFQFSVDFEVDPMVNISDILSMLLTAAVGIYLGVTISGRQSSQRFEKDFLINEVRKISEYIDSNPMFRNTECIDFEEAKKGFKEINIRVLNLESILSDTFYCEGISVLSLKSSLKEFRYAVTSLTPTSGTMTPTSQERQKIISKYSSFRKEIFMVIREINNA